MNNNAIRNMPQHAGNLPYMPLGMNVPPELKRWIGSSAYKHFNDRVNAMLRNQGSMLGNTARYNGKVYRLGAMANAARMFDNGGLEALDPNLFNAYQNRMNKFMKKASPPEIRNQIRQARALAGFLGGQLLAGGGQLLTGLGYDRAGGLVGNVGTGLTSGATAAGAMGMAGLGSAAGPIGILTGVVSFLASNYNDMQQFGEELRKSTEALVENYQVLRKQTTAINDRIIVSRHSTRAAQLLEAEDIDEARKQQKYWNQRYLDTKAAFEEGNPEGEQQKLLDEAEEAKRKIDKMFEGVTLTWAGLFDTGILHDSKFGDFAAKLRRDKTAQMSRDEAKNEIDKAVQERIKEMHSGYVKLETEMNRAKGIAADYQGVVEKIEKDRKADFEKSKAEVDKRLALSERNDQAIARYKAQTSLNQTQMFADSIIGDKLTSPLEKFEKIADELDKLRAQRASKMSEAFGISKEIQGGKMNSEDMARAMAKQARIEFEASSIQNQIGVLESLLGNINTNTIAPDLSHVTSLAQYGFNMGEKDDTVERMDKYYTKSINLQQQIKDKLEEGIKTEATYN